jgi:hypothetical protein
MENLGTNVDFLFFFKRKNRTVNPNGNLVFLITLFAKKQNDRQDLKMGCIDASRRQLQVVLEIWV